MDSVAEESGVVTNNDMEEIVRKLVGNDNLHVINVKFGKATSEVSGFMATHSRALVTVEQQGKEQEYTFFIKSSPKQESQKEFGRELGVFDKEIGFYTQIIPQISKLGVPLAYATCYLARNEGENKFLILEDLSQSGYELADRKNGLDFDHCCLVVTELAKLHAGSVALEQKTGRPLGDVFPFVTDIMFNPKFPSCLKIIDKSLETTLVLARQFLPHLKDMIPTFESRMHTLQSECWNLSQQWSVLNVVCHGDIWINNLLFAYENSRPVSVKLLDLQLARYGPPTNDIILFIWISTMRTFRKENEKRLLEKYYKSFSETLNELNVKTPEGFTFDSLWEYYNARRLLGAVYKIGYLPFILMDSEEMAQVVDPDKPNEFMLHLKDTQMRTTCEHFQRSANYRARMTEAIEELFDALQL